MIAKIAISFGKLIVKKASRINEFIYKRRAVDKRFNGKK